MAANLLEIGSRQRVSIYGIFIGLFLFSFIALAHSKTGFLVVAQDRGYQGNQEIEAVYDVFAEDYPSALLLIGPDSQGIEGGYRHYIEKSFVDLDAQDIDRIVAIPLFVSDHDSLLAKFKPVIENLSPQLEITWADSLSQSYLAEEILLDQVRQISKDAERETLIVLATGAVDTKSRQEIEKDLAGMTESLNRHFHFQNLTSHVLFDDPSETGSETEDFSELETLITELKPKGGQVLIVPFYLEEKFSSHMSAQMGLVRKLAPLGAKIGPTILPNPTVLAWLKQTANRFLPVSEKTLGIIIMPHGSTMPYNQGVINSLEKITLEYSVEFAFGMADREGIEGAVRALEDQGKKHVVFVRLFGLAHHMKTPSDYILGLSDQVSPMWRGHIPERVRTSLVFKTFGGYEETPLIAEVWRDRILEVSENPETETVIFLGHGSYSDQENRARLESIAINIAAVKTLLDVEFRDIVAMTVREDWPELREQSLREIRRFIEERSQTGRVIVISNRLYGSGSYARYLERLDYTMNGQGIVPHPNLARWVGEGIERTLEEFSSPD